VPAYPWEPPLDLTKGTVQFMRGLACTVVGVICDDRCEAAEFLHRLPPKAQVQFKVRMERLAAVGRINDRSKFQKLQGTDNVWEMKSDVGPGYRLFLIQLHDTWYATHGTKKPKASQYSAEAERAQRILERGADT
jgi:putative component of toxin-antitoxin plasmid stabilization module